MEKSEPFVPSPRAALVILPFVQQRNSVWFGLVLHSVLTALFHKCLLFSLAFAKVPPVVAMQRHCGVAKTSLAEGRQGAINQLSLGITLRGTAWFLIFSLSPSLCTANLGQTWDTFQDKEMSS